MLKIIIDKLKAKKEQLQKYKINNDGIEKVTILEEQNQVDINVSSQDNIFKIEISDYISISDFINKKNSDDEYRILDKICNCVLWNSDKQKVSKGTYYVIIIDNRIYNIYNLLFFS